LGLEYTYIQHAKQKEKLDAALNAGCFKIDGAIKGIGGCPMAQNELVGIWTRFLWLIILSKKICS
jgi:hypothetical protein